MSLFDAFSIEIKHMSKLSVMSIGDFGVIMEDGKQGFRDVPM